MFGKNNLAIEFFVICWQECLVIKVFLLGQSREFFLYSHHRSCAYVACRMANHVYLFLIYKEFINHAFISKRIYTAKKYNIT